VPELEELINGKVVNDDSKLWFSLKDGHLFKSGTPKGFELNGLIEARSLMMQAKLLDVLQNIELSRQETNQDFFEQVLAVSKFEIGQAIGENLEPFDIDVENLRGLVYEKLNMINLDDFRKLNFSAFGSDIIEAVERFRFDINLDEDDATVKSTNKVLNNLFLINILMLVFGGLYLGALGDQKIALEKLLIPAITIMGVNGVIASSQILRNLQTCLKPTGLDFNKDAQTEGEMPGERVTVEVSSVKTKPQ
jgi:hypothetical protein